MLNQEPEVLPVNAEKLNVSGESGMRNFRWVSQAALVAGLCLSPLAAAETAADNASNAGREHRSDQVQHGDREHPNWPKIAHCDNDRERDELREKVKGLDEKDREEFLTRLRDHLEDRRERLDHLCDCIHKHPHLSPERRQELLAIIAERREEIRERMKEFCENRKEKYQRRFELTKIGDRIEDLREFIHHHPCLSDAQKERLKDKLSDLQENRQERIQDRREDRADGTEHSAVTEEQKQALAARMAAMKKEKAETGQEIRGDVQDIKEDRQEIHADRVELHGDYKEIKEDKAEGNKAEVRVDAKEIHEDRKDLHQDQKDLVQDRGELREDLRDAGRPGLTEEQRAKMKARMEQARENRDGAVQDKRQEMATQRREAGGDRGNNGLGNGEDGQPRGEPRVNDGSGAGIGRPGVRPAR